MNHTQEPNPQQQLLIQSYLFSSLSQLATHTRMLRNRALIVICDYTNRTSTISQTASGQETKSHQSTVKACQIQLQNQKPCSSSVTDSGHIPFRFAESGAAEAKPASQLTSLIQQNLNQKLFHSSLVKTQGQQDASADKERC